MKDVFQQYASIQTLTIVNHMELAQFHRFLQDSALIAEGFSRAQADILFFHGNRGKNITFFRWVQVLGEIGRKRFATVGAMEAVERLVTEVIAPAKAIRANQLPVPNWADAMDSPEVKAELRKAQPLLDSLFTTFSSLDSNSLGNMLLEDYLHLATVSHLVPELLSKRDTVQVFRAAQKDTFSDLLGQEEFVSSYVCLAAQVFRDRPAEEAVAALTEWVSRSAQHIRVLAMKKGRTKSKPL